MTKEEAIKKVRWALFGLVMDKDVRDAFETLIPELRDNEDEELEKEIATWIPEHVKGGEEGTWKELREACTKWGGIVARHFAQWQKERIIQDAVEVRVQTSPLNGPLGISAYCCNFPSEHPFYHCKEGDKVKLIIVKEDEK